MSGRAVNISCPYPDTGLLLTVPLVPPSVNHYKMRSKHGHWYVSKEAIAFKKAVTLIARGRKVIAKAYCVEIRVYLGTNAKGDIDNYAKVVLDGLKDADVIHSDAAITVLQMYKFRDAKNPRTEIFVWSVP